MVTPKQCFEKWGMFNTLEQQLKYMTRFYFEQELKQKFKNLPPYLYINKVIYDPLKTAMKHIINYRKISEIKTIQCFNIRLQRNSNLMSLHSWGIAIDINAKDNMPGTNGVLSDELVKSFLLSGFNWGGFFKRKDPMHFQISNT